MSVENQEFRFTSAHPKSDEEQRVTQRWLSETPVIVIGLLLFSTCIGLLVSKGIYPTLEGVWVNLRLFVLFVIVIAAFDAAIQLYQRRPRSPIEHLKGRYFNSQVHATCLAGGPMLAIAIVLLPYFSKMKAAIPLFQPYTWDTAFAQWDRAIFFGNDAWQVLQPMLGFPIVTAFLALLYQLWFLLLYPGVLFFAFARVDGLVRRQFFLSYVLSWTLIGGLMATLLASVGPCFVGPILGDPSFDEQMAYLESANESYPVMVLKVQTMLLERFATAEDGLGSGITAMPSMHCAIAFLFWLAMRRVSERWGAFFGVFFFVTWLSSVHLAYHYAVDGLVSLLAVAAIWAASQRIIMAWDTWLERHETLRTNTAPAE
ncbi:MAG: phosphatase PAP2 family protein [Pseudomonadota bacterium]